MSLNSSTGFKKRNLLRPPSGILSSAREFLKVVDVSQSEPIMGSSIRTEVAALQEQINLLDKDKRIRAGESGLEKGYILNLKKWLREAQQIGEKEDDDSKILKQMGVDSYQAGFRKLWKVCNHLDLIISKVTELQAVQFIKYNEMFEALAEDTFNGQRVLQAMNKGGFNASTFQLSQVCLEREISLFELISELKRSNNSGSQNFISSKGFAKTKEDTSEMINQLRSENIKLSELLESIQEQQKNSLVKQSNKENLKVPSTINSPKAAAFMELEDKYKIEIGDLNGRIGKLSQNLAQWKVKCSQLETKLQACDEFSKNQSLVWKPHPGSYEEALLEEMEKMKKGFERKIDKIVEQFGVKQREMRKKEYEYKNECDKIRWEKGLLLKKFEVLSAV